MKADEYGLYTYRQNDVDHPGPYFGIQIKHMVLAGTIHADAVIRPLYSEEKLPVVSFLKDVGPLPTSVQDVALVNTSDTPILTTVKDIEMSMTSMVNFMVKWAVATIPAALLIGAIVLVVMMVITAIGAIASH